MRVQQERSIPPIKLSTLTAPYRPGLASTAGKAFRALGVANRNAKEAIHDCGMHTPERIMNDQNELDAGNLTGIIRQRLLRGEVERNPHRSTRASVNGIPV